MNVTVFSTQTFERDFLQQANADRHHLQLLAGGLGVKTVPLAQGSLAVSVFTADEASCPMLEQLWAHGVRYLLVRATGHSNVDLATAHRLGLRVANVPDYSPLLRPNTPSPSCWPCAATCGRPNRRSAPTTLPKTG